MRIRSPWLSILCAFATYLFACSSERADGERTDELGQSELTLRKGQPGAVNGNADYCDDAANRCAIGEGDCDVDYQCAGTDVVCGNKNGPRFGLSTGIDVCVPMTCANGVQDANESGVDCGGTSQCGACLTCPLGAYGAANHCSVLCPCSAGGGDCDANNECATGLVCKVGAGPLYGQAVGNDVCVPVSCTNGVLDPGEQGIDCGGSCGGTCGTSCPPAGQTLGAANFCSPICKCSAAQGDCDANTECQSGLVCGFGKGAQFNLGAVDVCVAGHCTNGVQDADETGGDCGGADCGRCAVCSGVNGTATFCDSCFCDAGQGHCSSTSECRKGLTCAPGNGAKFGFSGSTNVCVTPLCANGVQDPGELGIDCGNAACGACLSGCGAQNSANFCSPYCRCASGGGDCDTSADCQTGLVCAIGNGAKFGNAGFDFCVPAHCNDGIKNGDEGGVDCGGSCGSIGCTIDPVPPPCPAPGGTGAIFQGSFTIQNANDVTQLNAYSQVTGDLSIANGLASVSLPNLTKIGGALNVAGSTTLQTLSVPALASIGGVATLEANSKLASVDFCSLATAGGIRFANDYPLASVHFPRLVTALSFSFSEMQLLSTIAAPSLQRAPLALASLPQLTSVQVPALQTLRWMALSTLPTLQQLPMPAVTKIELDVDVLNTGLTTFDLPALTGAQIETDFRIQNNAALTRVSVPHATATFSLSIYNNASLATVDFSDMATTRFLDVQSINGINDVLLGSLLSVDSNITIRHGSGTLALTKLKQSGGIFTLATNGSAVALPELTQVGFDLYISYNANLATLSAPKLVKVPRTFTVRNNPLLPACQVQAIVAQLSPAPTTTMTSGNNPSGVCN